MKSSSVYLFTVYVYAWIFSNFWSTPSMCVDVHMLMTASHFHIARNYIYAVFVVISIFFIWEVTVLLRQLHQVPHLFHIGDYIALI